MSAPISDSRFHMWRAVFAMAHADGKITPEEIEFVDHYLEKIPFSPAQKSILKDDLETPKKVGDMLHGVVDAVDRTDFFQFATMMAWSDGEYHVREQEIVERLASEQDNLKNRAEILETLRQARSAGALRRALENEEYKAKAGKIESLSSILRHVVPWMEAGDFHAPDEEMFRLWRAVFSLVHADKEVSPEEIQYVEAMVEVFRFTDKQKEVIKKDMRKPQNVVRLFKQIESREHRRQFFVMARTILWCDGFLHELESKAIQKIVKSIGEEAGDYASELRWIDRKPVMEADVPPAQAEERMMQDVVAKMLSFYRDIAQ
ncbi:MAG: TerB family tellurite resistance protein [Alphaproteobacteria bacterium]|nr:TerB family tellurite resistance protein [Alphaproteobacteria bacterium]